MTQSVQIESAELAHRVAALERRIQIEEALERVRAQTIAMNASEELADMASVMFDNLLDLFGITPSFTRCVIVITHEDEGVNHVWSTDFAGRSLTTFRLLPLDEHPVQARILAAWYADKKGFISVPFDRQAAFAYAEYLKQLPGFDRDTEVAQVIQQLALQPEQLPEYFYLNMAFFSHGRVGMITPFELSEEHVHILKRFAGVFEQTYTRFLDLQRAEAFALEARQQASLDRVRGEIASMRNSKDLQRVLPLIWRELTELGVPFFRCGIFIMDDESQSIQSHVTTPNGDFFASFTVPFNLNESTRAAVDAWRNNKVFTDHWDKQRFLDWLNTMLEQGNINSVEEIPDHDDPPESLYLLSVPFSQGMLYVGSDVHLSDDKISLVQSLTDAFSVAYARYLDFQAMEEKNEELALALKHLEATQAQLIQAEKMASLGQLTAGIAHEIKNPLNFVNNFAQLNEELLEDLKAHIDPSNTNAQELLNTLRNNEERINEHGKRADSIVRSMMQHARGMSVEKQQVQLNAFVDEYLNLFIHGKKAQYRDFNIQVERRFDDNITTIEVYPQEMGRVLINLMGNAVDALNERLKGDPTFAPCLVVETLNSEEGVKIRICDNGVGVPDELTEKIFEPFFTTKPSGSGTGLGLSLSYDIVTQRHGGKLHLVRDHREETRFVISLPNTI